MESRRQTPSICGITLTRKYTSKSEGLRLLYVTSITLEDESGSDLQEICDGGRWTEGTCVKLLDMLFAF
jgi:hypothetical protein